MLPVSAWWLPLSSPPLSPAPLFAVELVGHYSSHVEVFFSLLQNIRSTPFVLSIASVFWCWRCCLCCRCHTLSAGSGGDRASSLDESELPLSFELKTNQSPSSWHLTSSWKDDSLVYLNLMTWIICACYLWKRLSSLFENKIFLWLIFIHAEQSPYNCNHEVNIHEIILFHD